MGPTPRATSNRISRCRALAQNMPAPPTSRAATITPATSMGTIDPVMPLRAWCAVTVSWSSPGSGSPRTSVIWSATCRTRFTAASKLLNGVVTVDIGALHNICTVDSLALATDASSAMIHGPWRNSGGVAAIWASLATVDTIWFVYVHQYRDRFESAYGSGARSR